MARLKTALLLFLLICLGSAQAQDSQKRYIVSQSITLAGATVALTIQATGSNKLGLPISANLECTVAAQMIISIDGTAATTTAATEVPIGRNRSAATITAFSSSNAGAGTIIAQQTLAADSIGSFDLSGITIGSEGPTTQNITLRTNSLTGDCALRIIWVEK